MVRRTRTPGLRVSEGTSKRGIPCWYRWSNGSNAYDSSKLSARGTENRAKCLDLPRHALPPSRFLKRFREAISRVAFDSPPQLLCRIKDTPRLLSLAEKRTCITTSSASIPIISFTSVEPSWTRNRSSSVIDSRSMCIRDLGGQETGKIHRGSWEQHCD